MVANNGLLQQSREEQLSEKSERSSENPARIEDIFEWIDGIPLSKTTKHLARDFSDAVLMAEILKFYYPHLVAPHNYIPANSIQSKKDNWNTLNRKVLTKIDMRLSPETIDQLAHSQNGVIDKILVDFRERQMSVNVKENNVNTPGVVMSTTEDSNQETCQNPEDDATLNRSYTKIQRTEIEAKEDKERKPSVIVRSCGAVTNFFIAIFSILMSIICFWRWFSRKTKSESMEIETKTFEPEPDRFHDLENDDDETNLRESYSQVLQELRVKSDVIKTLCHKVAFLEGTMKLKDLKINSLSSQLELHRAPSSARTSVTSASSSQQQYNRLQTRRRPRTQM